MCIAILNTKTATLKKQLLKNCWDNNGDGAGILYINENNKLSTFKEMLSFDNFYANYIDIKSKHGKKNIVLHFRISTHGKVNETNCHPFLVDESIGFVHNGMIYEMPMSKDFSDTYMFNEEILKNLKQGFQYSDSIMEMIEVFIGSNKLIFLDDKNEFFISNEKAGHWNMECWFSNSSYKQVNNYVDYGGVKKYKSYGAYGGYTSPGTMPIASKTDSSVWNSKYFGLDEKDMHSCTNCDMTLYGVKEIDKGLCSWCEDEVYANTGESPNTSLYDYDACDFCDSLEANWDEDLEVAMCTSCLKIYEDDYAHEYERLNENLNEGLGA